MGQAAQAKPAKLSNTLGQELPFKATIANCGRWLVRHFSYDGGICLRICLISREFPPDTGWGGIGAYTFQHARALIDAGHDVEIISLCKKDGTEDSTSKREPSDTFFAPVHRAVWGNLLQDLSTIWISIPYTHFALKSALALWRKFLEIHSQRPFDVIEAPEHLAEAIFPAITRICPLVVRLHTPHSKFVRENYHNLNANFDQRLISILERTAMLEADLLSSPSVALASYVAFDTGIDISRIQIVRNPVDTVRFSPTSQRSDLKRDEVTVFFAGRLEERKGVHVLAEAIPLVLSSCPKVKFVIVGADTNTGPGKSSVLMNLRKKLEVTGALTSVQFINHVPLTDMPDHYRSADICVVPSLYENAPYTVLEASASGRPVIGTTGGGSSEYISDGETGIVVPIKDSKALAQAIIDLANDENKRSEMGQMGRQRVEREYDSKIIAIEAVKSYQLAIEKHQADSASGLYRKQPLESLKDFVQLLYSYHLSLCDLIYRHSLIYRIKFWWKSFASRPRLTGAKVLLSVLNCLPEGFAKPFAHYSETLSTQIVTLEKLRENQFVEGLMRKCQLDQPCLMTAPHEAEKQPHF